MSYTLQRMQVGITGYLPGLVLMNTSDTLSEITSPDYLSGNTVGLSPSDIIFAFYNGDQTGIFSVDITGDVIVIQPGGGGGSNFNYVNTFWVAQNGSDSNQGTNQNSPFLTLEKAFSEIPPSISPPTFYAINIEDSGTYVINNINMPNGCGITINAPSASIMYNSNVSNGFLFNNQSVLLINCSYVQDTGDGSGQFVSLNTTSNFFSLNAHSFVGNMTSNSEAFLSINSYEGNVSGTGAIYGQVSEYAGMLADTLILFGQFGNNYYGDVTWNGQMSGPDYTTMDLSGPASIQVNQSYNNMLINTSGGAIVIQLPDQGTAETDVGMHFYVKQVDSLGTFSFQALGSDTLIQNTGTSVNIGDGAEVQRNDPTVWSASFITQATSGGTLDSVASQPGSGQSVYATQVGTQALLKRIDNTDGNIVLTSDENEIYVDAPDMITAGANLGGGVGVFDDVSSGTINFNTLIAGENIGLDTSIPNQISISATGAADAVTNADNVGSGVGIFQAKSGSILDFISLVAGAFITFDTSNPDQLTISGTGSASFNYQNTYFLASNGSNSNTGTSIDQPKQTLQAIISSIVNPSANNVIWALDGSNYLNIIPVNIPSGMNLTIYAPNSTFSGQLNHLFTVSANATLEVHCKVAYTNLSYDVISCTGNNAVWIMYAENITSGIISNVYNAQCELYVTYDCAVPLYSTSSPTAGIRGFVGGAHPTSVVGSFTQINYTLQPIFYNAAQTITIDSSFIGRQIVTESSDSGTYTIVLPDQSQLYIPPGSWFRVIQAGTDQINFVTTNGAVLDSDQDSGYATRTAFKGANIYVCVSYTGVVSHWSISGKLT